MGWKRHRIESWQGFFGLECTRKLKTIVCPALSTNWLPLQLAHKAPLMTVLLVGIPFEWVRVDLVEPLEPSSRGSRFIFILVDYANCYPRQ